MQNKPFTRIILILLGFLALTALAGGSLLMISRDGSFLHLTTAPLEGSPLKDYFYPGLFLVVIFGLGSILTMVGFAKNKFWPWFATAAISAMLVSYEIVERIIIGFSFLQIFYGLLGIILFILLLYGEPREALK